MHCGFLVAEASESIGYAGITVRRLHQFLALMLKTHHIETASKHLCVDQKTSSTASKRLALSLRVLWRQTLTHGIPALALVAGARLLHSRDVTSTFTDFTNPSFTVCFVNLLGFFSLECTDNGRDVGPDHIELRVPARGIAASDPVLCGCARPIGNFPSRQANNMHNGAMQLTERIDMPPSSYAFA